MTFYQTAADRQGSKGPGFPSWSKQWSSGYKGCTIQSLHQWTEAAAVFVLSEVWLNPYMEKDGVHYE